LLVMNLSNINSSNSKNIYCKFHRHNNDNNVVVVIIVMMTFLATVLWFDHIHF